MLAASSINLNLRLCGGAATTNEKNNVEGGYGSSTLKNTEAKQKQKHGGDSFKNILQGKRPDTKLTKPVGSSPSPYIREQLNSIPELEIDNTKTYEHCS